MARFEPFRDERDVLRRGILVVGLVGLGGDGGGLFEVRRDAEQGKGAFAVFGDELGDDVVHESASFLSVFFYCSRAAAGVKSFAGSFFFRGKSYTRREWLAFGPDRKEEIFDVC